MSQLSLGQFKTEAKEGEVDSWASFRDSFDNLEFVSDTFKTLCLESMELVIQNCILKTERGLDNKGKLEFRIFSNHFMEAQDNLDEPIEVGSIEKFKTKELAVEFFEEQKQFFEWNCELNKNNKVFDGQRYVWKMENEEITGERGY